MNSKKQLSIMEFSRLTGIKRENLRFYDRIGLLTPETRGDNKYRYYSRRQLNTAYLIGSLRGLGVGIEDIKKYCAKQSPEKSLVLFAQQDARIQAEIEQLMEARLIMKLHSDMVKESLAHDENAIFLQEKEREPIFLCPSIPPHMDDDEGGIFSYDYAEDNGINLGFPQGTMVTKKDLEAGEIISGGRYYFKTGSEGNACKPEGLYAVAYGRGDPWKPEFLYYRLQDFIREQNLQICGAAYEEYPLSELSAQDMAQYCIRVEIQVERVSFRS